MTDRATPFYCPYCADEDLRPHESGHASWRCGSCARVFTVNYVGLERTPASTGQEPVS